MKQRLDITNFQGKYFELLTDPRVQPAFPELIYDTKLDMYSLNISAKENSHFTAGLGGCIASSPTNQLFLQLRYEKFGERILSLYGNYYAGSFYNSGLINARLYDIAHLPYYFEFEAASNHWNYYRYTSYFFDVQNLIYLIEEQNYAKLNLTASLRNENKFGMNISEVYKRFTYHQSNMFKRSDTTDRTTYTPVVGELFFEHNSLNRKFYSNAGTHFKISARYANGKIKTILGNASPQTRDLKPPYTYDYFVFNADIEHYIKRNDVFSLGLKSSILFSTQELLENYTASMLNAPTFYPTHESSTQFMQQFRSNQYAAAGLMAVFNPVANFDIRLEGYAFVPLRTIITEPTGQPFYADYFSQFNMAFSGILVYYTKIAPISLSFNYYPYETRFNKFSFVFNIGVPIFNPKPL
ncbi:hypothetical protein FACS1894201_10500 [Bacteroidia bacterium]|nr:hypothetical protein FACS1894201_10500 [Bacteroidia bacterium]